MTPFIYDTEKLSSVTTESTFRKGLEYYKQNRVIECFQQDGILFALVEGSQDPDDPHHVELTHDDEGILKGSCDCRISSELICKHAIAALLSFTNEASEQGQFTSAVETAILDRIKRGQTEVKVKHLSGHPWFGIWQAASVDSADRWQRPYEVHMRSVHERINFCTCPDRANNQLGTCKHIEAVIHQLGKDTKLQNKDLSPPLPFVYLAWEQGEKIKVQRTATQSDELAKILDEYFDSQGDFKGELPEDYFRFQNAVYGNYDIALGIDARQGVERLATKQSHQLKAQQIRQQITRLEGQLPGLKARLYPYQVEGVAFLAANGRALLADDMGLGKTLQAIAAANWLIEDSGIKRILIVCPASLKYQWAREIAKFTGQSTQVVQGNAEARLVQYRQDKTWFIVNYELLLRDLSVINQQLAADLLILDEAQRIKNWRTKIATAVKRIHSQFAFVLTGTPLENRLEDLYSLMQVIDQHLLGPLWRYLNDYHIVDESGKVLGYRNLSALRQKISPVMLRRNRAIVSSQLPARTTTRIDITMTERQQELHDSALGAANRLAQIAKKRALTPSEQNRMMAALQAARMACNAAGLVDKKTEGSPKLTELKTLVEELCLENGQKMVIFSQWRGMTLMVEALLRSMKTGYVHLNGQVPTAKRGELMERFQNDPAVSVFISTDAGGTGLNLQSASVLVNLDMPWNPAVLEQRNARVHRLGQSNKVQIILMIARESYEERVLQLISNKQELFDNVVDPEATEDVVGISRKSIAAVIDELVQGSGQSVTAEEGDAEVETLLDASNYDDESSVSLAEPIDLSPITIENPEDDARLRQGLQDLHAHFGVRLEQVMARKGCLLLVLDQVKDRDETLLEQMQLPLPVAAVDVRSIRQLQRLGDASPLAGAHFCMTASAPTPLPDWLNLAREKFTACRVLLEQSDGLEQSKGAAAEYNKDSVVVELLNSGVNALLAAKAKLQQPKLSEEAIVWIHSEAVPQQIITELEANTITRILGLGFASKIPGSLAMQACADALELIG